MTRGGKKDIAASIRARLLNLARERGEDFQVTLRNYLFERFLYRLSRSDLKDRFVLKGAMLLRLWADQPYRATADLDLLSRGASDPKAVARDVAQVCMVPAPAEAASFDPESVEAEPIRAEDEYAGVRITLEARLGTIRDRLQIDVGFGDALWPLLKVSPIRLRSEKRRQCSERIVRKPVIAEKLEAIVSLGIRNSRIKDFFDIDYLARTERFDAPTLIEAICRTFHRRKTPIPADPPVGLTAEFWTQPGRPAQIRAFAKRARLAVGDRDATELGLRVAAFALPLLKAASERCATGTS